MTGTTSAPPVDRVGPWGAEHVDDAGRAACGWTSVGTRGSGEIARVDRAGLVAPVAAGWSLDWWVGADDRWHLPSRETAVRQELVEGSPVVVTRVRVPGGDVVQRVYAAQGGAPFGDGPVTVVEITNDTPVPVAVAMSVRAYDLTGAGGVGSLEAAAGHAVVVDGTWTVVADREARRSVLGAGPTDPVAVVTSGDAEDHPAEERAPVGDGAASFVFPLPHTATLRWVVARHPEPSGPEAVADLPDGDAVASGWARQADHGLRAVVPDETLGSTLDAVRRKLLLHGPDLLDRPDAAERAVIGRALAALGHGEELRPAVATVLDEQRLTGAMADAVGSEAATGSSLSLLGSWWRHEPRPELVDELAGPLAKAAHRIERRRMVRKHRKDPKRARLLPAGPQPLEIGRPTMTYRDDWWSAAGLLDAAAVLAAGDHREAAADAQRFGQGLLADIASSIAAVAPTLEAVAVPAGPDRPLDEGIVGLLEPLGLLGVVDPDDAAVVETVDLVRGELAAGEGAVRAGVLGPEGSPRLTALLALVETAAGDDRALTRLQWLTRVAGGVASWPRIVDGRGTGRGDDGDDLVAAALVALAIRQVLLVERRPVGTVATTGLDLLPVMPSAWAGTAVEVHDVPTTVGRFGFAVRWHGERPALLWELEPSAGVGAVALTASRLAPGWSTTEPVGETLLPVPSWASTAGEATMADEPPVGDGPDPADGDVTFS